MSKLVANAGTSAITVYPLGASGNVAPLRTIAGASTGLRLPIGLVVDSHDRLYAANRTGGRSPSTMPSRPATPRRSAR